MNKTAGEILAPYAINQGRREVVVLWEDAIKAMEEYKQQAEEGESEELNPFAGVPSWRLKGTGYTIYLDKEEFAKCETSEHAEYICKCIKYFETSLNCLNRIRERDKKNYL